MSGLIKQWLVPLLLGIIFIFSLGYLSGRMANAAIFNKKNPLLLEKREQAGEIPVVVLNGIEKSNLVGSIDGEVRLFVNKKMVPPNETGDFTVPAGALLYDFITVEVPGGMDFVASKKGTKYYPVNSAQGQQLAPENRVYFKTAEEAEKYGYKR